MDQFADVDAATFAAMVKAGPKEQFDGYLSGDQRDPFLDAIFRRMPGQFRPEKAGATNAVVHWQITGAPDGTANTYELVIADGACTLSPAPAAEPKVTFTLAGPDFLQLITGQGNPMMMFMTGKVKVKGDMGVAANIGNLFDLPKA
jgi:putative sterol carrier protein